jgi:hypothetical protein
MQKGMRPCWRDLGSTSRLNAQTSISECRSPERSGFTPGKVKEGGGKGCVKELHNIFQFEIHGSEENNSQKEIEVSRSGLLSLAQCETIRSTFPDGWSESYAKCILSKKKSVFSGCENGLSTCPLERRIQATPSLRIPRSVSRLYGNVILCTAQPTDFYTSVSLRDIVLKYTLARSNNSIYR